MPERWRIFRGDTVSEIRNVDDPKAGGIVECRVDSVEVLESGGCARMRDWTSSSSYGGCYRPVWAGRGGSGTSSLRPPVRERGSRGNPAIRERVRRDGSLEPGMPCPRQVPVPPGSRFSREHEARFYIGYDAPYGRRTRCVFQEQFNLD